MIDESIKVSQAIDSYIKNNILLRKTPVFSIGFRLNTSIKICNKHLRDLFTLQGHSNDVEGTLFFSGNLFLSSSWDNSIKIWDIKSRLLIRTIKDAHSDAINALCKVSESRFASGSHDKSLSLWDMEGQIIWNQRVGDWVRVIRYVPQRDYLIAGDELNKSQGDRMKEFNFTTAPWSIEEISEDIYALGDTDSQILICNLQENIIEKTIRTTIDNSTIRKLLYLGKDMLLCVQFTGEILLCLYHEERILLIRREINHIIEFTKNDYMKDFIRVACKIE